MSTLLSRSITVRLERKTGAEPVEMWIAPLAEPLAEPLRERCEAWAHHNLDALGGARPDLPAGLVNRAAEVWWALLAIADQVGGHWPVRARDAAKVLSTGGDRYDESSDAVMLLSDIRDAFGDEQAVSTKTLLERLNAIEEHPWGARRRGEGLDPRGLSGMLRPFGVKPRKVRTPEADRPLQGYAFDDFTDAFARHLPEAEQAEHPEQPAHGAEPDERNTPDVPLVPDVPDFEGGTRDGHVEGSSGSVGLEAGGPERLITAEEEADVERIRRKFGDAA